MRVHQCMYTRSSTLLRWLVRSNNWVRQSIIDKLSNLYLLVTTSLQVWAWVFSVALWRRPSPRRLLAFFCVGWCWARVWCGYRTWPGRHHGLLWRPWCVPGSRWPCGMLYRSVRYYVLHGQFLSARLCHIVKQSHHIHGLYAASHQITWCILNYFSLGVMTNEACMCAWHSAHGVLVSKLPMW